MGRQLRRVPLDFDHPVNKIWPGFLNPHYEHCQDCPICGGSGGSQYYNLYHAMWYGNAPFDPRSTGSAPYADTHPKIRALAERNSRYAVWYEARRLCQIFNTSWSHHLGQADIDALIKADRLWDFTRRPRTEEQAAALAFDGGYWMKEPNGYVPTAAEVNEWSLLGVGHDSINASVCCAARCERNSEPGDCAACGGSGSLWRSPEDEGAADAWEPTEPPTGEGWQMWETVSEGSPISPPFATAEELAAYLGEHDARSGTAAQWLKMILGSGWSISAVCDAAGFHTGVEYAAEHSA